MRIGVEDASIEDGRDFVGVTRCARDLPRLRDLVKGRADRVCHRRLVIPSGEPHRLRQIRRADEEDVDVDDFQDVVRVVDSFLVFELDTD